jgi:hypothetical protein
MDSIVIMISSPGISRTLMVQPPSSLSPKVLPRRGGIHSVYGLHLDGSQFTNLYKQTVTSRLTYC